MNLRLRVNLKQNAATKLFVLGEQDGETIPLQAGRNKKNPCSRYFMWHHFKSKTHLHKINKKGIYAIRTL